MTIQKSLIVALALTIFSTCLYAERPIDFTKKSAKKEIRHSMIGFRNTLIFYSFKDQQAILVVSINNKDETFPATAKVYLFDQATTEEGLNKWINNQHSDGLFPNVPQPIFKGELPKELCKVTSHKLKDTSKNPGPIGGSFKNFDVEFSVKEHSVDKQFKLSAFKDTAKVHVKAK